MLGVLAVALVLVAYYLKAPARKLQLWHYISGLAAWLFMFVVVGVAAWALARRSAELGQFPDLGLTFTPHFYTALALLLAMTSQTVLGLIMWFSKRQIPRLRLLHWRVSQVTLLLILILTLMGVPIAYGILAGRFIFQIILLLLALTIVVVGTLWVISLEQRSLRARQLRRIPLIKDLFNPAKPRDGAVFFQADFQPDHQTITVYEGQTLLEAALGAGIPHTHVCGGNARCSTCRVVVLKGVENLAPRNDREKELADRLAFGTRIRLACQTELNGPVSIRRLVQDDVDVALTSQLELASQALAVGREFEAAILFADIVDFTRFASSQLPYDVIHALNRYFSSMNTVISEYGGEVNNYMGDGLLALFRETGNLDASMRAIQAGLAMFANLTELRNYFLYNYATSLDIRVGLHYGKVVVGQMGGYTFTQQAVIGDAVNLAAVFQNANKEAGSRFMVSETVYQQVMEQIELGRIYHFTPKGRAERMSGYEVVVP
jgi:adenylate cyclase